VPKHCTVYVYKGSGLRFQASLTLILDGGKYSCCFIAREKVLSIQEFLQFFIPLFVSEVQCIIVIQFWVGLGECNSYLNY
jgi:hypothetical protein